MRKPRQKTASKEPQSATKLVRLNRPPSMLAQVELALRQAIAGEGFPDGKLPTEVALAEQLGVSRETVRQAAEVLQAEGLLVKIRRRGTFTQPPRLLRTIASVPSQLLGYIQTDFFDRQGEEEVANREISGLMLQGALVEAGKAGFKLEVQHTAHTGWREVTNRLCDSSRLRGLILASYAEDKTLRRLAARGLPTVLIDEDTSVAPVHSVRDDSAAGAKQAVRHLAKLGHRRIAYAHWGRIESNHTRPLGYREGLRDAGLPRRRAWEIESDLTLTGARELVGKFLDLSPRPTALYCFNNTLACLVIEELRRRGQRVPEDVSVVGAGGERVPDLTCHQVDWHSMGRQAVQILLRALAKPNRPKAEYHLSRHKLLVGRTTAFVSDPTQKATRPPRRSSRR